MTFSATDESHVRVIHAMATLKAEVYGVPLPAWHKDLSATAKIAEATAVPAFQPKSGVKIETDPKATAKAVADAHVDDEGQINNLAAKLEAAGLAAGTKVNPISFEKDDDTNYHMEVISGMANMRARAYSIPVRFPVTLALSLSLRRRVKRLSAFSPASPILLCPSSLASHGTETTHPPPVLCSLNQM